MIDKFVKVYYNYHDGFFLLQREYVITDERGKTIWPLQFSSSLNLLNYSKNQNNIYIIYIYIRPKMPACVLAPNLVERLTQNVEREPV